MEIRDYVLGVVLGASAVTFLPRVLPLVVLSRIALPPWLERWLGYIPVAVLDALLAQGSLLANDRISLPPDNLVPLAAIAALAVAIMTRSLVATVLTGIVAMALLRQLGG